MKRLDRPVFFNDDAAIIALSNNELVNSYPLLRDNLAAVRAGYQQYAAMNGDVSQIQNVPIPPELAALLKAHYASPNQDIEFIDKLRLDGEVKTCPMCGSAGGGTLDHFMPKADYPCFSIFGMNLVPACKCNLLRTNVLSLPAHPGARLLHPYYDDILRERLLRARFRDLGPVPKVTLHGMLDAAHPFRNAVDFHLTQVVRRTRVKEWIAVEWSKLVLKPSLVIRALKANPGSRAELVDLLEEERQEVDESTGSKNSWGSMLVTGLLEDSVVDWLFAAIWAPGRAQNGPLVNL